MAKRGKVLRDPNTGPGLLIVEGQQYPFVLEGVWRSEAPPKPGLVVEVEFSPEGNVLAVSAVPESQLAKEQAEAAMAVAKEKGAALASSMVAKFGMPSLVAVGLLIVAWFFLTAVSFKGPFGSIEFTFWQVLGFLNSSNAMEGVMQGGARGSASPGIYGFFAIAAIAGPFIHHFWKDKRALLGGLLPLLFMIIVAIMINSSINSIGGEANGMFGDMVKQMRTEIMKAITIGLGIYVSVIVSLYFAAINTKKFLAAGA